MQYFQLELRERHLQDPAAGEAEQEAEDHSNDRDEIHSAQREEVDVISDDFQSEYQPSTLLEDGLEQ